MDETEFEGSLVLEKLSEAGKIDDFIEAVDSDNFAEAKALMISADIDLETISMVLKKMGEAN